MKKKKNILLGLTGSVASVLASKLVSTLAKIGNVRVAITDHAKSFLSPDCHELLESGAEIVSYDSHEWTWGNGSVTFGRHRYQKNDPILHIDLRKWADLFVIAPITANTIAKITYGICDNLITNIYACWDKTKPVIIAPAMNNLMWDNWTTKSNLVRLFDRGTVVVDPVAKMLACNEEGMGAMADIDVIAKNVDEHLRWLFPLDSKSNCPGIPVGHPGCWSACRKHDVHNGVDLYCHGVGDESVFAAESGLVVAVENFTGPNAGFPWWNDTRAIRIEGPSGVITYGEIFVDPSLKVGLFVKRGQYIGYVIPVLREGKERPDIDGHSRSMLHIELHEKGRRRTTYDGWALDQGIPAGILDPTPHLRAAVGAPKKVLTHPGTTTKGPQLSCWEIQGE